MRAALFRHDPPHDFTAKYLLERLFVFMPDSLSVPVAPTREFWMHVLESKIKATIRSEGDMIGWEDDEEMVGPRALAAKQSLLRAVPYLLPPDTPEQSLYRFVLEHGDFGIHNTTIMKQASGEPLVTSLFDWETACIRPALLSDPLVAAGPVDLIVDENAGPSVARLPRDSTPADIEMYGAWASHYIKVVCYTFRSSNEVLPEDSRVSQGLYLEAPGYETAIRAGKDFRHLWLALRDWHGGDSEEFFGALGAWAEKRMQELGVF